MPRLTAMNAVKRGWGGVMDPATAKEFEEYGLDRVPDMFLPYLTAASWPCRTSSA